MSKLTRAAEGYFTLDELARRDTAVHRLHPLAKLIAALLFIAAVASSPPADVAALCPYCFYPFLLAAVSETPGRLVWRRVWPALPFVLCAGLSNILFDPAPGLTVGALGVSRGVLRCVTLTGKAALCVSAAALLTATTGSAALFATLSDLGVPRVLTVCCLLCFRYLSVLFSEAGAMQAAYRLRAGKRRGIALSDLGSFLGQLLLRSYERAGRIYRAMRARGFTGRFPAGARRRFDLLSAVYLGAVCAGLGFVRFVLARVL